MKLGFLGPNDVDGLMSTVADYKISRALKTIDLSLEILSGIDVALDYTEKKIEGRGFIYSLKDRFHYRRLSGVKGRAIEKLVAYADSEFPLFSEKAWDGLEGLFENGWVFYDIWDDIAIARKKLGKV